MTSVNEFEAPMLSIIMVNFYSTQLIERAERLLSGLRGAEFLVADNSGDFAPGDARTKVVKTGGNVGFGRACNEGAGQARGMNLLFLNPDCEIDAETISEIVNWKSETGSEIWGPVIVNDAARFSTLSKPGLLGLTYRRHYVSVAAGATGCRPATYVSGACLAVPREFFLKIGGFDERIFLYGEDLELCERARKLGGSVFHRLDLVVTHFGGKSSSRALSKYKKFWTGVQNHYIWLARERGAVCAAADAVYLSTGLNLGKCEDAALQVQASSRR